MNERELALIGQQAKRVGMFELANLAVSVLLHRLNEGELSINITYHAHRDNFALVRVGGVMGMHECWKDMLELWVCGVRLRVRAPDLSEAARQVCLLNKQSLKERTPYRKGGPAVENTPDPTLWTQLFTLVTRDYVRKASGWALAPEIYTSAWKACLIPGAREQKRKTAARRLAVTSG